MIKQKHFDRICSLMAKAMLFFCVNFSLNKINILPDWIGWICLLRIYDQLGEDHAECRSFARFALWLAWISGIEWAFAMVAEVQRVPILTIASRFGKSDNSFQTERLALLSLYFTPCHKTRQSINN